MFRFGKKVPEKQLLSCSTSTTNLSRIRIRIFKTGSADPDRDPKKWTGSATLVQTPWNRLESALDRRVNLVV